MTITPQAAIVTGAGSGIGRAIAVDLARKGKKLVVLDIDLEAALRTVDEIKSKGGEAHAFHCDVSNEDKVRKSINAVLETLPDVDALINSVGVTSPPGLPFTRCTEEDWDRVFAINVKSVFFMCKALAPVLIGRDHGRIVNIASTAGLIAAHPMPPYSVTKMGVVTLTKVLARDMARHGVTVNAVSPGFVWTDLWSDELGKRLAHNDDSLKGLNAREIFDRRVQELVPMGRPQTAEDVAAAVSFLVSVEASNITGQSINVDGGVTI